MNVQDAAYATVHCYPGGSESLAPRIGMSPAVLRGKVNPNNDRNILSLVEADTIIGVSGDHRILHALAAEHGYTLQPIDAAGEGGTGLVDAVLAASAAKGDLAQVIQRALADKVVTRNEKAEIDRACAALQACVVEIGQGAAARMQRGPEAVR